MDASDAAALIDVDIALAGFHPATRQWFLEAFGAPTLPQARAWPLVQADKSVLVLAQTGSGKTLAAFLAVVDRFVRRSHEPPGAPATTMVYVSPLKALATDIERNLRAPLAGIARCAALLGLDVRLPTVAIRTGDTDPRERARYRRSPADILITTPESLALLLTSRAGAGLAHAETVIVDEIHALVPTKRGAHLALTLERLEDLVSRNRREHDVVRPLQRIGLSATQRPLVEVARFLGGYDATARPRHVEVIDARTKKTLDVSVVHTLPEAAPQGLSPMPSGPIPMPSFLLGSAPAPAILVGAPTGTWAVVPPRITALARQHKTILAFVNSRRTAERLAATVNDLWLAEETADGRTPDGPLAVAHHGSLARPQRQQIEEAVKRGDVRVLVATSSMELGVDLPSVDVVVQLDAPPSVAAALQRVGRAGHQVGAVSRGVFMPRAPMDVLATAAIVPAMHAGDVEATRVVENPVDVLAQHLVGVVVGAPRTPAELYELVRGAAPWWQLSRASFDAVVQMVCGQGAVHLGLEGHEGLRGRLRLDASTGHLVARAGALRVAVQNIGTIPDRGLYGVYVIRGDDDVGQKVGELDEEMVFECRPGEAVRLGSSSWRIERITPDRVLVTPAPGIPGKLPFWKGEQQLRPFELGTRIGALARELAGSSTSNARAQLHRHGLEDDAATALVSFLTKQREQGGGVLPTDRVVVIERSRDELMDWRACLLSPMGGAVLQPLALAIATIARNELGLDLEVTVTNDGALFRFPESTTPPDLRALLPRSADVERLVVGALGDTPMFSARFREAAARALILPRGSMNRRAALWKQRQRARDLFDAVRSRSDFPLTLEAAREVLYDQFDLPALVQLLQHIEEGAVGVVTVDVDMPSPLASELQNALVRTSLYDDDVPAAERKAQALSIDLEQLKGLLGDGALRELLDVDVIAEVEAVLSRTAPMTWCRHADDVHDTLIRLGALSLEELSARMRPDARLSSTSPLPAVAAANERDRRTRITGLLIDELVAAARVLLVRLSGVTKAIAIEDAGRYQHALGVALPPGVPASFLVVEGDPLIALIRRDVRTHALSTAAAVAARLGIAVDVATRCLDELVRKDQLVKGAFFPGGTEPDYTTSDTLQSIRRRTLSALRQEAAPVAPHTFVTARLRSAGLLPIPPVEQTLTRTSSASVGGVELDRLREAVARLQGLPLPWSVVESAVLSSRVPDYHPEHLDALAAAGEVIWVGDSARGEHDGDVRLFLADAVTALWTPPTPDAQTDNDVDARVLAALRTRGASFIAGIAQAVAVSSVQPATSSSRPAGMPSFASWQASRKAPLSTSGASTDDVEGALWRLVWRGLVTNDGPGALRARARVAPKKQGPRRRQGLPLRVGLVGRFSLTATLLQSRPLPSTTERAVAVAEQLLYACGVLDNELVSTLSRGLAPANDVKAALRAMEDQGVIRRGYFVDGAFGLQYGTPAAVEALRAARDADDDAVFVVAAVDPAQPYGADVPWPAPTSPRGPEVASPQRAASAIAVIAGGHLVGLVVGGGKKVLSFLADSEPERSQQAAALARGLAHIAVTRMRSGSTRLIVADVDAIDVMGHAFDAHPLSKTLLAAGFSKSAGGYVWLLPKQPLTSSAKTSSAPAATEEVFDDDGFDALGAFGDDDDDGGFEVV
jgi:ATP-dependent Lhr-like helicase